MSSTEVAIKIREEQRDKFYRLLKLNKRCVFVAPPSLGKTTSSIRFALENTKRGQAVFVFSNNSAINYAKESFPETEDDIYITYASLLSLQKQEVDFKEYFKGAKFILFDEAHKVYAENWQLGVRELIRAFPNAYIAGTSIGYRTDGRDYIKDFFRSSCLAELNLIDCMKLGIVPTPTYIAVEKDMSASLKSLENFIDDTPLSSKCRSELKILAERNSTGILECSNLNKLLEKYLDYSFEERGTMRFVAFCPNISYINDNSDWLISEFSKAYPDKRIKIYKYHCKRNEKAITAEMQEFLTDDSVDIKILCSCQKVAESIHFNGVLTGLLFLRHTQSAMLFQQMFGRGLDANWQYPPIYIDIVDNLGQNFDYLPVVGNSQKRNPRIDVAIIDELQRNCILTDHSLVGTELFNKVQSAVYATMAKLDSRQEVEVCIKFKRGLALGKGVTSLVNALAKEYNIHTNYIRGCLKRLDLI